MPAALPEPATTAVDQAASPALATAAAPEPSAEAAGAGKSRGGPASSAGPARAGDQGGGSGAPASSPAVALARPGEGREGVPGDYAAYLARFRAGVQAGLSYPLSARRRGLSGTVELEVAIDADGRVTGVKVVSSSSHAVLDEAAADAVRRLPPLPFPAHVARRPLTVRLPLVFSLR